VAGDCPGVWKKNKKRPVGMGRHANQVNDEGEKKKRRFPTQRMGEGQEPGAPWVPNWDTFKVTTAEGVG